jgi:hypothetical protein
MSTRLISNYLIDSETNGWHGAGCRLHLQTPLGEPAGGGADGGEDPRRKHVWRHCDGVIFTSRLVISILERDPRCKVIMIDPDMAEPSGAVCEASVEPTPDGRSVWRGPGGGYGASGEAVELLS